MKSRDRPHTCCRTSLKYAIVFYCLLMIIACISIICFCSDFFGLRRHDSYLLSPRLEVYLILLSSVLMLIFLIGLIGSLLESVLSLRIFGGIVSYLFLLTFGALLYTIIFLIITESNVNLIASVGSFSAAILVTHALMAVAPFTLADSLIRVSDARRDLYLKHALTHYRYYR